jgi:hypothetical protein
MADRLNGVNDRARGANNREAIIVGVGGLVLLSALGMISRVGPGRAIVLGWRSYFKTTSALSVRTSEVQQLTEIIRYMSKGSYAIVTGGTGNGKSCLINTTLNRHVGVIKISVSHHLLCIMSVWFIFIYLLCYFINLVLLDAIRRR